MHAHTLTLTLLAALALALPARAQTLINVDFGVGEASAKTGFAATGRATNDFWNLYTHYKWRFTPGTQPIANASLSRLKLADGTETGVNLKVVNAPGIWGNTTGDAMYDGYIFAPNGSNMVVTISGVDDGRYNLYLYGHADPDATGEMNSVFRLASGGTNYGPLTTLASAGWKAAQPWREEHQFVVFRDVAVDAAHPIVIEVAPGPNGVAVLNGLQIVSRGSGAPRPAVPLIAHALPVYTNLVFREVIYDGKVSDNEARFAVTLDVESLTTNEISAPLFAGDVAVIPGALPPALRLVRVAGQYRLVVSAPGNYQPKLEVIAKITRAEPWNQISFTGPAAAIASVTAQAATGVELQLMSGAPVDPEKTGALPKAADLSRVQGFLGQDRTLALRWQSKTTEVARKSLVTVDTTASAQIAPTVIKFTTVLRYELLQASVPKLTLSLPATQALTRLQGEQIRDWSVKREGAVQTLTVEFVKPVEKTYTLTLFSEQSVDTTPFSASLAPPQPLEVERESGSFTLGTDDVTVEVESAAGLRQVNAAAGTFAAYRFYGRPFALAVKLKRIEPVINTADRITARLEETRLLLAHALTLTVEKAGIYAAEFTPQPGFVVADVRGEGVDDWKVTDGKLRVSFAARVLGARVLGVQLEQAQKTFPTNFTALPLRLTGATKETAFLGAASAAGIRLKTAELAGMREIPINQLAARSDELLAFTADQPDWKLSLAAERLPARIVAEVFNLVTIGDGLVGGSATVRYGIINQGVQEFRVKVPAHWKNVEFTGPNIRRKEQSRGTNAAAPAPPLVPPPSPLSPPVEWTISLQDKAWGGYTLVVTYDYQFDPQRASLDAAGLHTLGIERETGSVAITTAASLKLAPRPVAEPLRVIDQTELAGTDRALITRPVLLAYRYTGGDFALAVDVNRHAEERVLDAVADRTAITSVLTDAGEMLTQAGFMVKNNDRQFQAFLLPTNANLWGAYVNNQPVKAERDGPKLMVSLPRGANRDEAFAVDLVYAQKLDALKGGLWPQTIALVAPQTDVPNTYAEWQLFVPVTQRVSDFGGNMTVARGTEYGWRDAWQQFLGFYGSVLRNNASAVLAWLVIGAAVFGLVLVWRRGWKSGMKFAGGMGVLAIVGVILVQQLPDARMTRHLGEMTILNDDVGGLQLEQRSNSLGLQGGEAASAAAPVLDAQGNPVALRVNRFEELERKSVDQPVAPSRTKNPMPALATAAPVPMTPPPAEAQALAAVPRSSSGGGGGRAGGPAGGPGVMNYTDGGKFERGRGADGSVDSTFTPGTLGFSAPNLSITESAGSGNVTILRQNGSDGRVPGKDDLVYSLSGLVTNSVVAGDFSSYNGENRNFIARLEPGGKAVIGGGFTSVDGVPRNNLARLNAEGSPNSAFFAVAGVAVAGEANGESAFARSSGGAPPSAAGIRSIRIDIPRSGQAFTFTKVLNVAGDPLAIQMAVMNYSSFRTARSALQLACFLLGLALVWVQWRSDDRNSFWLAAGLVLALGAVGNLLLAGRVLHLGFIAAVPVVAFVALVWGVRKVWAGRRRQETEVRSQEPEAPAPASDVPPSVPPAAAIVLLLLTPFFAATGFAQAAPASTLSTLNPQLSTILSATYTGSVRERSAQFDVTIQLQNTATNTQTVPLFGADVAVAGFAVKTGDAKLVREGANVSLLLTNRGNVTLEVKLLVKLGGDGTRRRLEFALPPALSSRLTATIDEPDADVEFPSAVSFKRTTAKQQTLVEAIIGASDRVDLQWTPRMKRIQDMEATVFSQSTTVVTLGGGVVNTRAVLDYTVAQGELRQAKVRLPAGQRLLRVEGEWIRTWEIITEAGVETLVVDLVKGVSPAWRLTVETEKVLGALPATVKIAVPHATDVKRETGLVAVRGTEELALSVEGGAELQRVDTAEFLHVTKEKVTDVASAYRYMKPDFTLTARAAAVQPQIEASVRNHLRVGTEQLSLNGAVEYTIKRAGVFSLKLAIPAGWRVEGVNAPHSHVQPQWVERTEAGGRFLDLTLKERVIGGYGLVVALTQTVKELPKLFAVPAVHPLDVEKITGYVTASAEPGISMKTESFDNLTEIPVTSLQAAYRPLVGQGMSQSVGVSIVNSVITPPGQTAALAFRFISPTKTPTANWKLGLSLEQMESWVRAEVVNLVTVSETLVSGRALVRYEIANAPVKEFRLKLPAGYTNIEITGVNIRRRDASNDVWRVELQNKVRGTHTLAVSWELPRARTNATLDLPGVEAVGVERETGSVAVLARPPLQVLEKNASSELVKIDARELPEWAGVSANATGAGGDAVVLAYRYLRPGFKLGVTSKRFDEATLLQALVDHLKLTTIVADDGQVMTEMTLAVRNNGLQFIELELPPGAKVWSAFVCGQPVRPSKQGNKLLLPLDKSGADEAAIPVELIYVGVEKFPKRKGAVALASPTLDVPFKNARWELYLPRDYAFTDITGSMTPDAAGTPVLQTFSAAAYGMMEAKNRELRWQESSSLLSNVKAQLQKGNVREANEALNNARSNPGQQGGVVNDEQLQKGLKDLEKDLKRAQGSNLINAQRAYSTDNFYRFNGLAQPQADAAGKEQAQAAQQAVQMFDYDAEVAEQQVAKLQQQQEIAVAKVQPLRVNLPLHGQKLAFTQVLQTETQKPMTLRFAAQNTKVVNWTARAAWAAGAFLALWIAAALLPRRGRA